MPFKFFRIAVCAPAAGERELNAFLARTAVSDVQSDFVADGQQSFWAYVVTYTEGNVTRPSTPAAERIDYRQVLSPDQFQLFARMRELRKELALRDQLPAYAIFNDKQLHAILTGHPLTVAQIKALPGVTESRAEKYGEEFLRLLGTLVQKSKEKA